MPSSMPLASVWPQCGQNLLVANALPKHLGQARETSPTPQYWHFVQSALTAPPQLGHCRDFKDILLSIIPATGVARDAV